MVFCSGKYTIGSIFEGIFSVIGCLFMKMSSEGIPLEV